MVYTGPGLTLLFAVGGMGAGLAVSEFSVVLERSKQLKLDRVVKQQAIDRAAHLANTSL